MPIYEYICRRCDHKFEVLHRTSKELKPTCPQCQAGEVERLLSAFGFSCGSSFVSSSSGGEGCSGCSSKDCSSCG